MATSLPPYWRLISVLFSTRPLEPVVAVSLYQAAHGLYRRDETLGEVAGDTAHARVRNLRQHVNLGVLAGPAFEAQVDADGGPGLVRFFITREGLEALDEAALPDVRRALLN